jgi:hypothetical protein
VKEDQYMTHLLVKQAPSCNAALAKSNIKYQHFSNKGHISVSLACVFEKHISYCEELSLKAYWDLDSERQVTVKKQRL